MNKKVIICDDDSKRIEGWKSQVEEMLKLDKSGASWDVETMTGKDLANAVKGLTTLEQFTKSNLPDALLDCDMKSEVDKFDNADLVILDSDLSPRLSKVRTDEDKTVSDALRNQWGDLIARLIRTHTDAGYIVVANQFSRSKQHFDLTMMEASSTFADLHISAEELSTPALWTGDSTSENEYNSWAWPILSKAGDLVRAVRKSIEIKDKVLDKLDFDKYELTERQLDIFGETDPKDATFQDLAFSSLGFGEKTLSGPRSKKQIKRMAASVVYRWLFKVVLPAQNVVSDVPHLSVRFPVLTDADDNKQKGSTRKSLSKGDPLLNSIIGAWSPVSNYVGRPVYNLNKIRSMVPQLIEKGCRTETLVFAEDTSELIPESDATQFMTDVPGSYARRYVRGNLPKVTYHPVVRIL